MTETLLFYGLAILAAGGGLAVVLSPNIVRMAIWLIVSLVGVAGLFFLLGAEFLGATQLLIYVGGTVVLLIFGVMLTATGPLRSLITPGLELVQGCLAAGVLLMVLTWTLGGIDWTVVSRLLPQDVRARSAHSAALSDGDTTTGLGLGMVGVSERELGASQGRRTQSSYLLPFEVISVHLLVVLIGAAYLARTKRRAGSPQS